MNIINIINKKRNKNELTKEEISYVVENYVNGNIPDYQMSSLLMAICINDMTDSEVYNLTLEMLNSGDKIDLSEISGVKIDKHSTGGVGDKTSLIVLPIVASLNVAVAKMSGKGLGHTGGTIDKLESIKNFNTNLTFEEFINQVKDINLALVSQMGNLVPADKKIYQLRDVTGTTESIPLIASSIMSKKLASGADKIVLDVKVGKGALVKNLKDARRLSKLMVDIGNKMNKETVAIITNMNEPLGNTIGNALEVKEAIEILNNKGDKRLRELSILLASTMVSLAKNISNKEAEKQVCEAIENKSALNYFYKFIEKQNGDINNLKISDKFINIQSDKEGYITDINALKLGLISMEIGAGRKEKNSKIDYSVGIKLNKKIGDYVKKGDTLLYIYFNEVKDIKIKDVINAFDIKSEKLKENILVYDIIRKG